MPSSPYQLIPAVLERVLFLAPKHILDVGMGSGKYGFLCREYLEMAHGLPRIRVDGIEVFAQNVAALQRSIYDEIFVGDAREVTQSLTRTYDVALVIEVLEHMEFEEAAQLIAQLRALARHVLITVPRRDTPQEALYGNEHERHQHQFTRGDLRSLGFTAVTAVGPSWVAIAGPGVGWFDERPWWWKLLRPVGRLLPEHLRGKPARRLGRVFGWRPPQSWWTS